MTSEEIHRRLAERFGGEVLELVPERFDAWIGVDPTRIDAVASFCKEDPELRFTSLMCLSGVDDRENIKVVYHLHSMEKRHRIVLKVTVPKDAPQTLTVSGVWRAANWFERECYDLFGVRFEAHPELRRILLPNDWEGHPLRKEYVFPKEYGGTDNTRDYSI